MRNRALASLRRVLVWLAWLLLALLWVGGLGLTIRAAWSENNPTHVWGEGFSGQAASPTPPESWPMPKVTNEATCEWTCAQRGLYARWSARDVPCVCSVLK